MFDGDAANANDGEAEDRMIAAASMKIEKAAAFDDFLRGGGCEDSPRLEQSVEV